MIVDAGTGKRRPTGRRAPRARSKQDWRIVVPVDSYGAVTDETGKTLRCATVAEYFRARLGRWLEDPQTKNAGDASHGWSPYNEAFHIETGCGEQCKAVIDFAGRICSAIDTLSSSYEQDVKTIIRVAEQTVLEFVYG